MEITINGLRANGIVDSLWSLSLWNILSNIGKGKEVLDLAKDYSTFELTANHH